MMKNTIENKKNISNNFIKSIISLSFQYSFIKKLNGAIKPLKPIRAIIFGSSVKKGLKAKDIDILIISKSFYNILWQNRPKLLSLPPGPNYDLRLYTPEEFERFYPPSSALRKSIENQYIDLEEFFD